MRQAPLVRGCLAMLLSLGAAVAQNPGALELRPEAPLVEPGAGSDARPAEAAALLQGVEEHPALAAARAAVRAAERELRGVSAPVTLEASYRTTHVRAELPEAAPPGTPDPGGWDDELSLDLRARPFLYGDLADLASRRRLDLERARLELRATRARLETAALDAAAGLLLAERGASLAERALTVAERGLDATRLRAERGSADPHELERSELAALRARHRLQDARRREADAERALAELVGQRRLGTVPELPRAPELLTPDVRRAEMDLELAQVGAGGAERALYPTASARYRWPAGDGALSLSLESQTLQPTLSYRHPGGFEGALPDAAPGGARPEIAGTFTVGVSLTLTPERFHALEAARDRVDAATSGVEAARRRARDGERQRETALAAVERQAQLAAREAELARRELDSTRRRVDLGLEAPLAVDRAELGVAEAELTLLEARVERLRSALQTYRDTATPPSEVLP